MLVGQPVPLLLIGFVLQVVCALAAAVGVWRGRPWAAGALVLLGASIAATWLIEGFVLGIVAYLHALLVAVPAIVVALVIAVYVNRQRWSLRASSSHRWWPRSPGCPVDSGPSRGPVWPCCTCTA